MDHHVDIGPRDPILAEQRPPQPSMMTQRLLATAAISPPTTVAASAPKTRPFQVQPPPAHLYSSADSWNPNRSNVQVAPSRPPKLYDSPPPSILYRRPSATPERPDSFDPNPAPAIPPITSVDSRIQRHLEPTRQSSPPSVVHSRSVSRDQQQPQRASAFYPFEASQHEPSAVDEQSQTLPPRPARRPFEVEPPPEPERRGSASRPFQVRASPNPLDFSTDRKEASRLCDIPFRSPMFFPAVSSERPGWSSSLAPEATARKGSTPTFEFEPPTTSPVQAPPPQEAPTNELQWFTDREASPPSPKLTTSPPSPPSPTNKASPSSPESKTSPPLMLNPAAMDEIQPPSGPPPTIHKSKKSVSFATRDSIISASAYPQSPFSDDSYLALASPLPLSMESPSHSPQSSTDERHELGDLPMFLMIDEQELNSRLASASADAASPTTVESSNSCSVPPVSVPPPVGPPPGLPEQPPKKDDGIAFDNAVAQLVDYGFSTEEAQRGLLENGAGIDVQAAANWLLDEANAPEPPPLPQRPGKSSQYAADPPSPLSPSDDASSDLYEPEPVSPVSLYAAPPPKVSTNSTSAQHARSRVLDDPEPPLSTPELRPRLSSSPTEKHDTTTFKTHRPSSSVPIQSRISPSPPLTKAASLEQQDLPAQPPTYAEIDHRAMLPNPLSSHPVQVGPYVSASSHKITRKKVPLASLDAGASGGSSSSQAMPPQTTMNPTSAIVAATMASFTAAVAPVAPEVQHHADLGQKTSSSSVSSLATTTMSPRSSTDTGKPPRKRRESLSKAWGSRFAEMSQKANKGIANLATKVNHAGFVGETVDKECEKAARILRVFCKHGVYTNSVSGSTAQLSSEAPSSASSTESTEPASSSNSKTEKKLVKIPPEIMQKAVGLAIFTTLRVGLGLGESTGSGIVVARLHDGSWSPPSAIQLQSFGAGVAAGVDIFDCVCVINTQEALSAFTNKRFSLGAGVAVAAGPWGTGRSVEWGSMHSRDRDGKRSRKTPLAEEDSTVSPPPAFELNGAPLAVQEPKNGRQGNTVTMSPVYSYVKSKGLFAGLTYAGNIVIERSEANKKFYEDEVTVEQILRGAVRAPEGKASLKALHEALLAAEDYNSRQEGFTGLTAGTPTIHDEGVIDSEPPTEPQTNWPMDIKPKFPEDSLHPAEALGMRR